MFVQRALMTLILAPIALYLVYLGGWFFFIPVLLILLIATVEYNHMMREMELNTSAWFIGVPTAVILLTTQFAPDASWIIPAFTFGILSTLTHALWMYEKDKSQTVALDWMAMMGGIVLMGILGSYFLRLRNIDIMAWQWMVVALVSTWSADGGAYMVGKFMAGKVLGRHKLSPRLSPNKTIEGFGGGIVIGTAMTLFAGYSMGLPLTAVFILGILISTIAPLGDLSISLLKRESGVKDSGIIFGSHGGALDRIDSLLWSVTLTYYVTRLLI